MRSFVEGIFQLLLEEDVGSDSFEEETIVSKTHLPLPTRSHTRLVLPSLIT